jgi:hypothetical protein
VVADRGSLKAVVDQRTLGGLARNGSRGRTPSVRTLGRVASSRSGGGERAGLEREQELRQEQALRRGLGDKAYVELRRRQAEVQEREFLHAPARRVVAAGIRLVRVGEASGGSRTGSRKKGH